MWETEERGKRHPCMVVQVGERRGRHVREERRGGRAVWEADERRGGRHAWRVEKRREGRHAWRAEEGRCVWGARRKSKLV